MAYFLSTPPSVEEFLDGVVQWVAHNLRAKITVQIDYSDREKHFTAMCDFRLPEKKRK